MKADLLVSVITVLEDQAPILPGFVEEVSALLEKHYTNYEIVLIDNASTDQTGQAVAQLLHHHKCLRYLRLTRPADEETALIAGLDAAIGDYVVTIHPDFDPPAEIIPMVEACRAGIDLVLGIERTPPRRGPLYRVLRRVFLGLARGLARLNMVSEATGYRVFSRQAVNALVKVRVRWRLFAVVATDVGLTTATHAYDRTSRSGKQLKPNLLRALRVGLSALVHSTLTPLRLASALGLFGSGLSFLYSLYVVAVYLVKPDVMPGWTTLSLAMSGLFGLVFLILALMGEYLGRLLEESTDRPLYHVRDEQSSAVMLTDLSRRNVLDRSEEAAFTTSTDNTP